MSYIPTDDKARKALPIFTYLTEYFPDATLAEVGVAVAGNEQHNPGQPLHWARGKSMDHSDCIMRHLANYDGMDGESLEAVALFWRAGALCQEVLERKYGLTVPRGATDPRAFPETNSLVGPNGEQAPLEIPKVKRSLDEIQVSIDRTTVLPPKRKLHPESQG